MTKKAEEKPNPDVESEKTAAEKPDPHAESEAEAAAELRKQRYREGVS